MNDLSTISLDELTKIEKISVRAYNVCKYNSLITLQDIIRFYQNNKPWHFRNLRNCGRNTNDELVELSEKYIQSSPLNNHSIEINSQIIDETTSIEQKVIQLSFKQKRILNNLINNRINELTIRSLNALKSLTKNDLSVENLIKLLSDYGYQFKNIKNIGKKSEPELTRFYNWVEEQIDLISTFSDDNELTNEIFNSYIINKFNLTNDFIIDIWRDYDFNQGVPVFKTFNLLIDNYSLFDKNQTYIFKNGFNFYNEQTNNSLDDLSKTLNYSRERTRQLRKIIYDSLNSKFLFVNNFDIESINLYGIETKSDFISITSDIVSQINSKEKNSFSVLFINKILSIILIKSHTLIGDEETLLFNKSKRNSHNWESSYLIDKEIAKIFDFYKFVNEITYRLQSKIDDDYHFHFETYLTKFLIKSNYQYLQKIFPIAEQVLFNEFQITLDQYENIVFKRNSLMQVYEYAYLALEELGKPSKVSEIYSKVVELYPNYKTDENSIRASMTRNTGFVPFGRTSVYGLSKWEKEKNIKGGTIRDIVEEYLIKQDIPKHIDEITEYVQQYRKTNAKNIFYNLKMEVHNRFVFYSGSIVGLKSKTNDCSYLVRVDENRTEKRSWDENFELLNSL